MRRSWVTGAILFALIAALLTSLVTFKSRSDLTPPVRKNMKAIGPIVKGTTVQQEFVSPLDRIFTISLFAATYRRVNTARVTLKLEQWTETGWKALTEVTESASGFQDNAFHTFEIPPVENVRGKRLRFTLTSPDGTSGNAIAVWTDPGSAPVSLFVNGKAQGGYVPMKLSTSYGFVDGLEVFLGKSILLTKPLQLGFLLTLALFGYLACVLMVEMVTMARKEKLEP